jgi:uncharacterized protein Yka (UPF0111/DUF47 family)
MFSIQKLFARDTRFFELLDASAQESRASVQALKQILNNRGSQNLDEFVAARKKEKQINAEISKLLARTTVTSLDREDIESISSVLYKIPKTVEKFAERYVLGAAELKDVDFTKHIQLLEQATDTVAEMVKELQKAHFEKLIEYNERLQATEGAADDLMLKMLKELYSGKVSPLKVMILKDLYELLEKVVDRCRDVGNVIANIVLKHS